MYLGYKQQYSSILILFNYKLADINLLNESKLYKITNSLISADIYFGTRPVVNSSKFGYKFEHID